MNSNCIQNLKKMAAALLLALVLLTSTQLPARADDMAAENIILTVGAGDIYKAGEKLLKLQETPANTSL